MGTLGSISRDGQRIVFALPLPPDRKEVTVAPEILTKYVGTYVCCVGWGYDDWVVTLEGSQLMIRPVGSYELQQKFPLFAESETYFFLKGTNGDIEFVKDDNGNVTHLNLYQGQRAGRRASRK